MASQLKVDTLTGVTTAGSIDVTGEGNSTTTNLQQGLAKSWAKVTKGSDTINDSFSVTSITDTDTGKTSVNSTVTFGNINGSLLSTNNESSTALGVYINWTSTTVWVVFTKNSSGSFTDHDWSASIHGDLA